MAKKKITIAALAELVRELASIVQEKNTDPQINEKLHKLVQRIDNP